MKGEALFCQNTAEQEELSISQYDVDEVAEQQKFRHQVNIGGALSAFKGTDTYVQNYHIGWTAQLSSHWILANEMGLLKGEGQGSLQFSHKVLYKRDKYGVHLGIRYSNNNLSPSQSTEVGSYHWVGDKVVLTNQLTRIAFRNTPSLLPLKSTVTWINGRIGWTIGMTQDLSSLSDINPLFHLTATYENSRSDVFSLYASLGSFVQPEFSFQIIDNAAQQIAFGGWFRKKLSTLWVISSGWGFTHISDKQQLNIRSHQLHLSITYKL